MTSTLLPVDAVSPGSHLTKAEYLERKARELPILDNSIIIPKELKTKKLKDKYVYIAAQLDALGIWSALDADELCRYVIADALYLKMSAAIDRALKDGALSEVERLQKVQDRAYKQAHASACTLCLNITSRVKVSRPTRTEDDAKEIKM